MKQYLELIYDILNRGKNIRKLFQFKKLINYNLSQKLLLFTNKINFNIDKYNYYFKIKTKMVLKW